MQNASLFGNEFVGFVAGLVVFAGVIALFVGVGYLKEIRDELREQSRRSARGTERAKRSSGGIRLDDPAEAISR